MFDQPAFEIQTTPEPQSTAAPSEPRTMPFRRVAIATSGYGTSTSGSVNLAAGPGAESFLNIELDDQKR
jgi:hypothetical protein